MTSKNPVRTLRVAPGSALDRLTTGLPFTEAVHKIAEVLELALAEEAANDQTAPPPGPTPATVSRVDYDPWAPPETYSDQEALAAVAEQYPAGLVPVAVVHEDDELLELI